MALVDDLGLFWRDLPGDRRATKAYSLTMLLKQNGRLADLLPLLQSKKPNINWQVMLVDAVQEEALQTYCEQMSNLLVEFDQQDEKLQEIVKKQTSNILQEMDGERKGSVLRFLRESGLIDNVDIFETSSVDLSEANLRGTNLTETSLVKAYMAGANLSKANLSGADLQGANLIRANLGGANLWSANLSGADLSDAHMWGANLNKANLYGANLSRAHLSGADMWGADLRQADLYRAYLWGVNLDGADLRGAKHVTAKQLTLVKSMEGALLPDLRRHIG